MTAKDRFEFLTAEYGHLMKLSMVLYQKAVTAWYNREVLEGRLTVEELMGDVVWLCNEMISSMEERDGNPETDKGDGCETESKTTGTETEGTA